MESVYVSKTVLVVIVLPFISSSVFKTFTVKCGAPNEIHVDVGLKKCKNVLYLLAVMIHGIMENMII